MGKKTDISPQEVLQKAITFFRTHSGLMLANQSPTMVYLVGGTGHVQVTAMPGETEKTEVDVQTREWDYDVKQFLKEI